MKFNYSVRRNKTSITGQYTKALGLRVGYFPCLKGPFIEIAVWSYSLAIWYGLEPIVPVS